MLLRVTVIDVVDDKVKLYQTSSSGLPVHGAGIPVLGFIFLTVSFVLVTPTVSNVALAQLSLVVGGVSAKIN